MVFVWDDSERNLDTTEVDSDTQQEVVHGRDAAQQDASNAAVDAEDSNLFGKVLHLGNKINLHVICLSQLVVKKIKSSILREICFDFVVICTVVGVRVRLMFCVCGDKQI